MIIMSRLPQKNHSSDLADVIDLDDSVNFDPNATSDVICLDSSANSSTAEIKSANLSVVHRLKAEVDLTSDLTRIKDYSDKYVTIPAAKPQTKRKAEIEVSRPTKLVKAGHLSACNETVIIDGDINFETSLESLTTHESSTLSDVEPSTSTNDLNVTKNPYIQAVTDACLASLSAKLKPNFLFTPYHSLFKGCAVTKKLLMEGDTSIVPEAKYSKKRRKECTAAENSSSDADCILIESESEDSNSSQDLALETKTCANIMKFSTGSNSSPETLSTDHLASKSERNIQNSKNKSCDNIDSKLKQDKIALSSKELDVVEVIDDNVIEKEKSDALKIGKNVCLPAESVTWKGLRPIIIDGSNVAFSHGLSTLGERKFSCKGIEICVNYFKERGHKVIAFVPLFRKSNPYTIQSELLVKLAEQGNITFTPSRRVNTRLSVPYDDRYIVQAAVALGGVIVSSDNYRDLLEENEAWRSTIENRLLMFTFVGDMLMFPQDPLGRTGPSLDEFLRFPE